MARLRIKSNVYQMRFECKRCEESEELYDDDDDTEAESEPTRKINLRHCHCSLWKPSDDLVASMSGGQPRSRYLEELAKIREAENSKKIADNLDEASKKERRDTIMREAVKRMKRRIKEKRKEEEQRAKKKANKAAKSADLGNMIAEVQKDRQKLKEKKRKREEKEEKAKKRKEKRQRLYFCD